MLAAPTASAAETLGEVADAEEPLVAERAEVKVRAGQGGGPMSSAEPPRGR